MSIPETEQSPAAPNLAGLDFDEPLLDFTLGQSSGAPSPEDMLDEQFAEIQMSLAAPGDDEMVLAQVFDKDSPES